MACLHVDRNVPVVHIACLSLQFVLFWFPWLGSATAAVGVGLCRVERLATSGLPSTTQASLHWRFARVSVTWRSGDQRDHLTKPCPLVILSQDARLV